MKTVNFEWDPAKASRNRRKHRISFEEAATVFGDSLSITWPDPDHSESEARFIAIGHSSTGRLLMAAHADRAEVTRIISPRRAARREREQYEEE